MELKPQTLKHIRALGARCPAWADALGDLRLAVEMLCQCHARGGKVLLCGNGGSAADCEHIVGELAKRFVLPRRVPAADAAKLRALGAGGDVLADGLERGMSAIALFHHGALATATINDGDPDLLFAQQVYVYGKPGDVLLAISTSGHSKNVVLALQTARAFGLQTLGLTGVGGGAMKQWCDLVLCAPAREVYQIQELHLPFYHALCLAVEAELFGDDEKL